MARIDRDTLDQLAGEYVLGTLEGRARRRFERLVETDADAQARVAFWERKLAPMADTLAEQTPSPAVWDAVVDRTTAKPLDAQPRPRAFGRRSFWLGFGAAAAAAAVAVVVASVFVPGWLGGGPAAPTHFALLAPSGGAPTWLVTIDAPTQGFRAYPLGDQNAGADRSFELWLIPRGGKPVSLGVLPAADVRALPAGLRGRLAGATAAISREPAGGSPTGAPTGPVVFTGAVHTGQPR